MVSLTKGRPLAAHATHSCSVIDSLSKKGAPGLTFSRDVLRNADIEILTVMHAQQCRPSVPYGPPGLRTSASDKDNVALNAPQ